MNKRHSNWIATAAIAIASCVLSTGCASMMGNLSGKPDSANRQVSAIPNSVPSKANHAPASPSLNSQAPNSQAPSSQPAVAQVGFHTAMDAGCGQVANGSMGSCSAASCGPVVSGPVASGSANCGPANCGPAPQAIVPHGYATLPTAMPPAYGLDPQEFLCNGGDREAEARVRRDDSVAGVNVSDAVVHYTTEAADIEVRSTNQVCLYAPRFKSVRKVTGAVSGGHAIGLGGVRKELSLNRIEINEGGVMIGDSVELAHADVAKRIDAMRDRNRGVPVEAVQQPQLAADVLAALINLTHDQVSMLEDEQKALLEELSLAAVAWTMDESLEVAVEDLRTPVITRDQSVEGFVTYEFPEAGRLQVSKLADRSDALPGEYVSFAISIQNVGDSPVNQVVITDSLTTRLEYVDGSQTCSAGAKFQVVANEAQSLKLTWELTDELKVGESATIRFRCKVR